jgi:hypothetical protein
MGAISLSLSKTSVSTKWTMTTRVHLTDLVFKEIQSLGVAPAGNECLISIFHEQIVGVLSYDDLSTWINNVTIINSNTAATTLEVSHLTHYCFLTIGHSINMDMYSSVKHQ